MTFIQALLNPTSVVVVGASSDPNKLTGRPIAYLQQHGYQGQIYPINPRSEMIGELKCYADAQSLPEAPDLGLVLVGANRVIDAVRGLSAAGTKAAVVLASGFGEAGEEGQRLQAQLREAAGSMRILGPNTIGLVNLTDGIMLTASGAMDMKDFRTGGIAVLSQSGGILGSLLSRGVARGIGFSKLVATGNEADIEVADLLDAMTDDPATTVVALYLETIRNVEKFRRAAARVIAAGKSIVAYKVGRSETGAQSAVSHTGALAGADRVYDALFTQLGIIRAQTFADLLDIPAGLAQGRVLAGKRVAIVTSTGGAATIVADNVGLAGLEMPSPDPETAQKLLALDLKEAVLDRNPIDVTLAGLRPDLFRAILKILAESPSYDAIVVVVGSSSIGQPDVVARPLLDSMNISNKPIMAYVSPDAPGIVQHLNASGIPAYAAPESCAAVLKALVRRPVTAVVPEQAKPAVDLSDLTAGALNEADAKRLCARFGFPITREVTAMTPAEAAAKAGDFGGPVVIKILSDEIMHKSEVGGVAVGVALADVEAACEAMLARVRSATTARIDGLLIQELVKGGVEFILGYNCDPQLGAGILLGAGGVQTELYQDVAMRLLPVTRDDVKEMIGELKCAALLDGFRGRPVADTEALVDAVLSFAEMVVALDSRLDEAEINPVFVLEKGNGVRAGDALAVLR
ncbi:acyl-CoA synthetase (NDP forming) [Agrobacterium tumefaciens]|uniref:Acyl-CoA synthetase (NDP forming) n=1 Tax=Agrobacterium radiobacter TaxID=362 RepID=A0ABR6JCJ3_AGRRD|nr:acetate--CoA ligase family protein [Agrobacterium radiobacter]MBB4320436.1 acyl-CoA synthetase (NDP forming) [Agrobacterium radiobacter]MBB4337101.1 acyl-CoA synthetase (NDP forming) [Agrobacterium radiobacter]MBB4492651.1 acyl-CoA synthetase (NDP forming) [Agrobacterium radiobacter]MBB4497549.1 acyl-CoA synthetase (NDP forming) [Agrobacterium radiobacter]MBB4502540.1 acyl-CoA synthetase (NDP forming) [Agrobacterium radiobacter]